MRKITHFVLVAGLVIAGSIITRVESGSASTSPPTCSQTGKRPDNSNCEVGDIGPGGGVIYYDAGSMQSWGRYLEVAPNTWSGGTTDPYIVWCNPRKSSGSDGREIGNGKSNFDQLEGCAIHTTVSAYRGGGQSDWFVPSDKELRQLKTWQQTVSPWRGGFLDSPHAYYWTSTRYNTGAIFWYFTADTRTNTLVWPQIEAVLTRPIRYVGLNPAQTVTWSPDTSLVVTQSPHRPTAAATNGGGAITYSKVSNTTTTCSVNSSTGELTFTGLGNCVVRATAAATDNYSAGVKTVTFTVTAAPQVVSWSPTTNLVATESPVQPAVATSNGPGAITYSKVSNTTTTCSVNSSTGELTFTGLGNCVVKATAAATSTYLAGSEDVTFTIGRAPQRVTWNPSTSLLREASPVTPAPLAVSNGDGNISYEVVAAGATGCTIGSTSGILAFTSTGSCSVRATASETDRYSSASIAVTFTIAENVMSLFASPTVPASKKETVSPTRSNATTTTTTSTTTTTTTTTTTIAPPVVSNVSAGEALIEIDGETTKLNVSRAENALILEAGTFSAKVWATSNEGLVLPLDSDGNIRVSDEANISFTASGFAEETESEVWVFSTPTLLGLSQVDLSGNVEGVFSLPESMDNGSHRIVLVGEGRDNKDIKVVVGMIIGNDVSRSPATIIFLTIVISLAILSALFLPAIIRRRRAA